ncbi:hypothetical protein ACQPZ2_03225 [Nocardia pseudovaccinii]|uniref:hypothetical protein n=1 Tax=Nocardia pseudovaccinii TaxID=189540 RepID=UPI003D8F19DA
MDDSDFVRFVEGVRCIYGPKTVVEPNPQSLDGWLIRWSHDRAVEPFGEAWVESVRDFVLQAAVIADEQSWLREVADRLNEFEHMLNDFVGVDLSTVNLAGIPLDGLRWSGSSTRWPVRWQERVERDSIPVEDTDDLFEIQYGTHVNQDVLV